MVEMGTMPSMGTRGYGERLGCYVHHLMFVSFMIEAVYHLLFLCSCSQPTCPPCLGSVARRSTRAGQNRKAQGEQGRYHQFLVGSIPVT